MAIHEEKVRSPVVLGLVIGLSLFFLIPFLYLLSGKKLEGAPSAGYFLGLTVFVLLVGFNFWQLTIRLEVDGLYVGYPVFYHRIPWHEIESCSLLPARSVLWGGGLHITRRNNTWCWEYAVPGRPRMLVMRKSGKVRAIAFSTENPDRILELVRTRIGPGGS